MIEIEYSCPECFYEGSTCREELPGLSPVTLKCVNCREELTVIFTSRENITLSNVEAIYVFGKRHRLGIEGSINAILEARRLKKKKSEVEAVRDRRTTLLEDFAALFGRIVGKNNKGVS